MKNIKGLVAVANKLDQAKLSKAADFMDQIIRKIAEGREDDLDLPEDDLETEDMTDEIFGSDFDFGGPTDNELDAIENEAPEEDMPTELSLSLQLMAIREKLEDEMVDEAERESLLNLIEDIKDILGEKTVGWNSGDELPTAEAKLKR